MQAAKWMPSSGWTGPRSQRLRRCVTPFDGPKVAPLPQSTLTPLRTRLESMEKSCGADHSARLAFLVSEVQKSREALLYSQRRCVVYEGRWRSGSRRLLKQAETWPKSTDAQLQQLVASQYSDAGPSWFDDSTAP